MKARDWVQTGLALVFAALLFSECSIQGQPTQAPHPVTGMPSPSATPTGPSQPTAAARPTGTPRPTPTAPPTQTPTPPPTLDPDEMEAYVREMLRTNAGCELPCWWGITPGETRYADVEAAFLDQGINVQNGRLDLRSWDAALGYRLEIEFEQEDGLVQSVSVSSSGQPYTLVQDDFAATWQRYALPQVLARYGVPSEVYLSLDRLDYRYGMYVVYDDRGIAFSYPGIRLSDVGGWWICPVFGQVEALSIRLQSPAVGTPFVPLLPDDEEFFVAGRLAELTGMDVRAFHGAFSRPDPQTCAFVADPLMPHYDDLVQSSAPALSREEEDAFLVDMLATNGGCELPCWWGITPGVTGWQEAQQLFLSRGKDVAFYSDDVLNLGGARQVGLFGRHALYPFDYVVVHRLYERDGVVQQIGVLGHTLRGLPPRHLAQDWQRYTLDQILARFGRPSQVLLHYWSDIPDSHYSVGVMYEERGILVEYMGLPQLEMVDDKRYSSHPDPVVICPTRGRVTDVNLWLQPPDAEMTLADVFVRSVGGYYFSGIPSARTPPTLEEATGMGLDEFYGTFRDPDTRDCLEASPAQGDYSE